MKFAHLDKEFACLLQARWRLVDELMAKVDVLLAGRRRRRAASQ
jgi:hypothetical protein